MSLAFSFPVTFQAKYEEANALYVRSLAIAEDVYGPDHPEVARCLNNWAGLLFAQVRAITILIFPAYCVGRYLIPKFSMRSLRLRVGEKALRLEIPCLGISWV